ncbi:cuticle protein 7-like [Macrobrachium rosenbergii]|uniref:cuticle protein 7-like n=1 Tax=Macrobrachium rosenbergii TaxID=79674 RepID=UPI0034D4B691
MKLRFQIITLAAVVVIVTGDRRPYSYYAPQESSEESYESTEAKYDFDFAVKHDYTGANFGHRESRDGSETQGSYYVQLPDGRLQTVRYYVDGDSGYVAEVSYEGEARYPDSDESRGYSRPRVSYSAPRTLYSQPRISYSPPDSAESYAPSRSLYSAPDSGESYETSESLEIPRYIDIRPLYG